MSAGFFRDFVAVVVMRRRGNLRAWVTLASLWLLFIGTPVIIVDMQ